MLELAVVLPKGEQVWTEKPDQKCVPNAQGYPSPLALPNTNRLVGGMVLRRQSHDAPMPESSILHET